MRSQVRWVADYLPKDRPVHLLRVGQVDDIIDLVKYGVDTLIAWNRRDWREWVKYIKLDDQIFGGKLQTAKICRLRF